MKTLNWRLVKGKDFVSSDIEFIERGFYSHVEFLSDDLTLTYGAMASGGVKYRDSNYPNVEATKVFSVPVPDINYDLAWKFLLEQEGDKYNFAGIVGVLLNDAVSDKKGWFCSQLWIATMIQAGLVGTLSTPLNHFTPQDALNVSEALFGAKYVQGTT
jgi:hypothetical protein